MKFSTFGLYSESAHRVKTAASSEPSIISTAPTYTHFPEEPADSVGRTTEKITSTYLLWRNVLLCTNLYYMGGNVTCQAYTCSGICHPPALNPRHRPGLIAACDPSHKLAILRHNAET
jgi:hypothetical protein